MMEKIIESKKKLKTRNKQNIEKAIIEITNTSLNLPKVIS